MNPAIIPALSLPEEREVPVTPAPVATASVGPDRDEPDNARSVRGLCLFDGLLPFLLFLAAWLLAAEFFPLGDNPLIPHPLVTLRALRASLPELWIGTLSSLAILLPGFAAATLAGVAFGVTVGTSPRLQRIVQPFARVAGPVPPTVYVPYAIAVLPTFRSSAIFVVFIGAFWPIFQNAAAGAQAMEARYRDNARILGLSGLEYRLKVVLPAALPHIFSGMSVGLAFSFILLTVAELFGANAGLGRFVQYYADFADYPKMVAGILYTGLVTFLTMSALDLVRHRLLFWHR